MWSKVLLDKRITNRTKGLSYWSTKNKNKKTLIYSLCKSKWICLLAELQCCTGSNHMAASAPPCLRCMDSACGKAAKVLPPHHAPPHLVQAIRCIGLQIEVVVDYEISLWLSPCVASRVTRIAKQRRLQGWWQQRRRWVGLAKACSYASRHKCKVYALPAAVGA